jgi:hypothetical protein
MVKQDFVYLNVPGHLEAKAWIVWPEGEVEDVDWKQTNQKRLYAEVLFYHENNLLREERNIKDWQSWVLNFSDFTEEGQGFLMADYPGKWHAAWDRNPTKDPSDVRYLQRKLKKMREQS